MNRRLIAMLAGGALVASAAQAEIVLAEDLSLSGYLDMYAVDNDLPGDNSMTTVAEFETAFNYTTEPFFATVELSFKGTNKGYDDSDVDFETAIIGWAVDDNLTLAAGNILSYLGWEAYDATGLYQFTYAYRGFTSLAPAYAVGAAADYVTDEYSLGLWVGDSDNGDISYELAAKFTGVEGLTLFAGWADDPGYETLNFWASYEFEGWTFAAEYIDVDYADMYSPDAKGYLFMVNYTQDNYGITARYSVQEDDDMYDGEGSYSIEDWKLFTISPSYTFSDNLLGLLELSLIDSGGEGMDYQYGIEFIFTY